MKATGFLVETKRKDDAASGLEATFDETLDGGPITKVTTTRVQKSS